MLTLRRFAKKAGMLAVLTVFGIAACRSQSVEPNPPSIHSTLTGIVTVSAEVDTTRDFSGFSVIVGREGADGIDTLGFALTTSDGRFSTRVEAPRRGVYPLIVAREGTVLFVDQLVVADGDSATFSVELPARRPARIGGMENAAWMAYQNTRALHNQGLIEVLQGGNLETDEFGSQVHQASTILWGLQETFPGTLGSEVAAGESIVMLEAWNDSLLIDRARSIAPDNPTYLDVARAARRAAARVHGQEAALSILDEFADRADDRDMRAALIAERVIAHIDSFDEDGARQTLAQLRREYRGTEWVDWAEEAEFELDNLMPGRPAPELGVVATDGSTVTLADLRGKYTVVEFFIPESEEYHRQLPIRNALLEGFGDEVEVVSLSLQPDEAVMEAFFEDRDLPGRFAILEEGAEADVVRRYNVKVVPSRFLIDPDGNLVGRYIGEGLYALQSDLAELLAQNE
jgi:peroxiredoxin